MAVNMGNRWFPPVECTNKKDGKKEAADIALRTLMAEGSYQATASPLVSVQHEFLSSYYLFLVVSL